ncbi:histidinol-phosphate transaminase [Psychrobacter sp. I-STPA6b]|uniref:histidinol-phosphate transaminase n=1 Tax=Psychrobacter sp. I-STPA6b TaxID=2585718 RepID=UPI001D0C517F|nr:histidinol-phosphate transaminase [Psychrobacter sp. I-STPA6b]
MSEQKIDTRLWSSKARHLSPYIPGEQPKQANLCKLNTNENPFPPSPKVAQAIAEQLNKQAYGLRLYPEPESSTLKQQLAKTYQVQPNQIFVGNGSDEVLALVFACFFMKERPLLSPDISYSFYPVYAETFGVDLVKIPLQDDFSINPDDYRQPCGGIIIANPNAPTGLLMSLSDIRKLASEHPNAVVVIDEAYIDFAEPQQIGEPESVSAVSLIDEFDNIVVTQTFSKSRSLAGLRVGMAFANPSLIEALTRMKNSFNSYPLDKLAQAGAIASLQDDAYFNKACTKIIELRNVLSQHLAELGFSVLPSQANFIFARPPEGNAEQIAQQLREQGIIVRYFSQPRIDEYLRITVGTTAQNGRLIEALTGLLSAS